jgi:hypothetical protein
LPTSLVPTEFIVPSIKARLAATGEDDENFSYRCGIHFRELQEIFSLRRKRVGFDRADTMLCRAELVHLWWEWPLLPIYLSADLR